MNKIEQQKFSQQELEHVTQVFETYRIETHTSWRDMAKLTGMNKNTLRSRVVNHNWKITEIAFVLSELIP